MNEALTTPSKELPAVSSNPPRSQVKLEASIGARARLEHTQAGSTLPGPSFNSVPS